MRRRITLALAAGSLAVLGFVLACARPLPPSRTGGEAGSAAASGEAKAGAAEAAAKPAAKPAAGAEPSGLPGREPPPEARPTPPATPAPAVPAGPIRLRVGLATDLDEVWVPCCDEPLILGVGDRRWAVRSPLRVVPDPASARQGIFRLQVAALKDEAQASGLARHLAEHTGYEADSHFDAGVDLYRVRVGRFASREEAGEAREHLAGEGVIDAWIASEGAGVVDPSFLLVRQGTAPTREGSVRLTGRWMSVEPREGGSVPDLASRRGRNHYRGRLWLYLNDRGKLNLINEIDLDDYLRSVVASEMGPEVYGHPEALKAQAVAARTYTLKNLGEFSEEGYDICATPRCQVYRGQGAEHPLSDRAVAETSGQVLLWHGELIDARYSSSCGGHTENVSTVFPLLDEPYLVGVPCPEAGEQALSGSLAAGTPFPAGLLDQLLPPPAGARDARAALEARLEALAGQAGLVPPRDRLGSLERGEVRRFVASLFDLALDPQILQPSVELAAALSEPPAGWSEEQLRQASHLAASGLLDGAPEERLTPAGTEVLLLGLARLLRVVRKERVHFLSVGDGELEVRSPGGVLRLPLPEQLATFERRGERIAAKDLEVVAGDRLDLFLRGRELAGAVLEIAPGAERYRLRSRFASWRRFRTDADLARRVSVYYPGLGFTGLEVLSRGVSGRVGALRLLGSGGRTVDVEGLAVRWTLDLPDTRFTARRVTAEDGRKGWLFVGSGWGHGVGMCQIGSVNLAGRGLGYREILEHYYTGVELARVRRTGSPTDSRWERDGDPPGPVAGARR